MKKQCYEIFLLEKIIKGEGFQSTSSFLEITSEAEYALDSILEKFDTNSFSFMIGLNKSYNNINWWPWAIIVFGEEYRFAGHLASIRENKSDFNFTAFSIPKRYSIEEHGVPPVSVISIKNKGIFSDLAARSPLFHSSWELLKSRDNNQRWLIFPEPPEKGWLMEMSGGDDELFLKLVKKTLTKYK